MKFLTYLQEEYIDTITGKHSGTYSGTTAIFHNPTPKELRSLDPEVRFIINFQTKSFYVWDWNVTHSDVAELLYKQGLIPTSHVGERFLHTCFAGMGDRENKIRPTAISDCLRYYSLEIAEWKDDNDKWLSKWFGPNAIQQFFDL